jgi:cation:H+ antiporter
MEMMSFTSLSLGTNMAVFAAAACIFWGAGIKLTGYARVIAVRTGAEQAFVGILLLGAVVSLPETATTVAAAANGQARLAVSTLLGGIAATIAILAVTDALTGSEPLSTDISHPIVLLQGILVVLFLTIASAGIVVGDTAMLGVGLWTTALLVFYMLFILVAKRYGARDTWIAQDGNASDVRRHSRAPVRDDPQRKRSLATTCLLTAAAAVAILAAGFALAGTGEALAEQTGLGASFVGMLLGGIATSLPEVSTTIAAVRLAQYEMAFADAFGTNLFSTMLLFVADLAYPGGPILNEVDRFSLFAMLLGILLTAAYLAGFVERRRKTMLRMGIDSIIVLLAYGGGLVVLFFLR